MCLGCGRGRPRSNRGEKKKPTARARASKKGSRVQEKIGNVGVADGTFAHVMAVRRQEEFFVGHGSRIPQSCRICRSYRTTAEAENSLVSNCGEFAVMESRGDKEGQASVALAEPSDPSELDFSRPGILSIL